MYPSNYRAELRAARASRRLDKVMIYFFSICTAYVAGFASVIAFLASLHG